MNLAEVLRKGQQEYRHAIAISQGPTSLTYGQVYRDVERIAAHLAEDGVRPGQVIAVDLQRPISHWIVLLALMRIGTTTISLTNQHEVEAAAVPNLSAVVKSADDIRDYPDGVRQIELGRDWLQTDTQCEFELPSPQDAALMTGRVCFTSGTAGKPKAIVLSADQLFARLSDTARRTLINARSILWCGLGPDTAYGFTAVMATLAEGGMVVFARGGQADFQVLYDHKVNLVVASPAALGSLLRDAQNTSLPPLRCAAIVAGGKLPVALRDAVKARLCLDVFVAFGASEVGGITLGDSDGLDEHPGFVGRVFDDIDVQIVNNFGQELPPGSAGQLRVRSPSSVSAYLNDAAATAQHFDAGWFVSGDLARISAGRVLTILGRQVDTLNLGGVKLAADEIDAAARKQRGVEDACAVVMPSQTAPYLALVIVGEVPSGEAFAEAMREKLPGLARFVLIVVAALPRGSMGKLNREALAATLADGDGGALGARRLGIF